MGEQPGFNPDNMESLFRDANESADQETQKQAERKRQRTEKQVEKLGQIRKMQTGLHEKEMALGRTTPKMDAAYDESNAISEELMQDKDVSAATHEQALKADALRNEVVNHLAERGEGSYLKIIHLLGNENFDQGLWETLPQDARSEIAKTTHNYLSRLVKRLNAGDTTVNYKPFDLRGMERLDGKYDEFSGVSDLVEEIRTKSAELLETELSRQSK